MSDIELTHNQPEYTVTELSGALKRTLEDTFGYVRVRGEISGYKKAPSGHAYFNLKDENAVLAAVCWKMTVLGLPFKPEDGVEVTCIGRVTAYAGRSQYQLVVEAMEPAGIGALMALLEKRKSQFISEGLFDASRKKLLPFLPEVIGVITSPTGAVIRDILHRLSERFPRRVLLWPVLVQGEIAASQVAAAIKGFNALPSAEGLDKSEWPKIPRPDIVIIARGGGSFEDLWPSNEEIVVRAVVVSVIPIISAIGHETDTTLIDHAADVRAPTPTAAAEMAVPVRADLYIGIEETGKRLSGLLLRLLTERSMYLQGLERGLPKPMQLLEQSMQHLDMISERLYLALPHLIDIKRHFLASSASALRPQLLLKECTTLQNQLASIFSQLSYHATHAITLKGERLSLLSRLLESFQYKKILERGFALVRNNEGNLVDSAGVLFPGQEIELEFHDGKREAIVNGKKSPKRWKKGKEEQGFLF